MATTNVAAAVLNVVAIVTAAVVVTVASTRKGTSNIVQLEQRPIAVASNEALCVDVAAASLLSLRCCRCG